MRKIRVFGIAASDIMMVAVPVIAAGATLVLISSGSSYPAAWCGPVISQVTSHEPGAAYRAAMQRMSPGGPGAALYADQVAAQQDYQAAQQASNENALAALALTAADLGQVRADLDKIASGCKVPAKMLETAPHSGG